MDLLSLTPAELGYAQRKAGLKGGILGIVADESHEQWVDALVALAFVVRRRDDADVDMEAIRSEPMSALVASLGLDTQPEAEEAEEAEAGGRGRRKAAR
jgi:hypothetical protein